VTTGDSTIAYIVALAVLLGTSVILNVVLLFDRFCRSTRKVAVLADVLSDDGSPSLSRSRDPATSPALQQSRVRTRPPDSRSPSAPASPDPATRVRPFQADDAGVRLAAPPPATAWDGPSTASTGASMADAPSTATEALPPPITPLDPFSQFTRSVSKKRATRTHNNRSFKNTGSGATVGSPGARLSSPAAHPLAAPDGDSEVWRAPQPRRAEGNLVVENVAAGAESERGQ